MTAAKPLAATRAPFVDLECHVLPLLDALEWMARASYKLGDLDALGRHYGPHFMVGSEYTHTGELVAGVAWVAGSLLRRHQEELGEAAEGGAA
jgi:hypothetical protein